MSSYELNANNIGKALPEEVLSFLHERYDSVEVPTEAISFEDMAHIEQMMGWIANENTFLNYIYNVADISCRNSKLLGLKEKHELDVIKKNVIKSYKDNLESINKLLSRKITLYQMNKENERMENRVYNSQRGDADAV